MYILLVIILQNIIVYPILNLGQFVPKTNVLRFILQIRLYLFMS